MSPNEVIKVEKVFIKNKETGETFELDPTEVFNVIDETVQNETICFDDYEHEEECVREALEESVVGSSLRCIDDELCLVYLDENNKSVANTNLMPDIINVQNPNDRTVFVEFADGTKEVALLNEGDTFNLETGILICVVKKLFSDMDIIGTGSSVYNKVIKYALGKLDYTKKQKKKLLDEYKDMRIAASKAKQEFKRKENGYREERISEMSEAYKRAIKEIIKDIKPKDKNKAEKLEF